ncbi:MAG TPA: four helix bundle protein [Anaerolineae bacterium]|nr:four helix bundle protein [Anaerolineae bacterium]
MNFDEWLKTVPSEITADSLWQMTLYRQALFLGDIAWLDVCKLAQDQRTQRVSDQLYRAVGSVSTNIAEGYSKASGKDQARFYEYALGSAREARDWYYKSRHVLGEEVALHRMRLTVHIIRQLLKLVPEYRGRRIREEAGDYEIDPIEPLLANVPLPAP